MEKAPGDELVVEARDGTGWASARRARRRAYVRKGEPAGTGAVKRDSASESKRRRRPGKTTRVNSRGTGGGGVPSMYASQDTPSSSVNGIPSVRTFPRGYNGVIDTVEPTLGTWTQATGPTISKMQAETGVG
jgi:hypothetical protein